MFSGPAGISLSGLLEWSCPNPAPGLLWASAGRSHQLHSQPSYLHLPRALAIALSPAPWPCLSAGGSRAGVGSGDGLLRRKWTQGSGERFLPVQVRNSKVDGLPWASLVSLALHSKGTWAERVCHGGRWSGSGPEDLSPSLLLALPHDLGPFSHKSSGLPQIKGSRWDSAGSSFLCLSGFVKYLKCQGPWEPARFCHNSSGVCPVPVEGQPWRRAGA